ncbi:hypothetical protein [Actinomycetospora sp.]|jgi:hypothetical protein|uniref:hypothetical protein n=1 Tax=Actinomycetospora sp. TaxID=1872135 RepID=UPI002F412BDE
MTISADPAVPSRPLPRPRRSPEARPAVSPRDRAVLLAVAAGRATVSSDPGGALLIDGQPCSDQFAGRRLVRAGLMRLVAEPPGRPSTTVLTAAAIALLGLPISV